jgi:hypothetical protein
MESKPELGLDMLVLDAIQDDVEQLPSIMRMLAEWRHQLEEEFTVDDVLAALARLLHGGLVGALEESRERPELVPVPAPDTSPRALRRYWYEPTTLGRARWESWDEGIDSP